MQQTNTEVRRQAKEEKKRTHKDLDHIKICGLVIYVPEELIKM